MPRTLADTIRILDMANAHFVLSVFWPTPTGKTEKAPASIHAAVDDGWLYPDKKNRERTKLAAEDVIRWLESKPFKSRKGGQEVKPSMGIIPASMTNSKAQGFLVLDIDKGGVSAVSEAMELFGVDSGFVPSLNGQDGSRGHLWLTTNPEDGWENIDGDWRLPSAAVDNGKTGEIIHANKWVQIDPSAILGVLQSTRNNEPVSPETIHNLRTAKPATSTALPSGYSQDNLEDSQTAVSNYKTPDEWVNDGDWAEGSRNIILSKKVWHIFANPQTYPPGGNEYTSILTKLLNRAAASGLPEEEAAEIMSKAKANVGRKGVQGTSDAKRGRGRPRDDEPSEAAKAQRRYEGREKVAELSKQYSLELRHKIEPDEKADVARIAYFCKDSLVAIPTVSGNELWVCGANNLWRNSDIDHGQSLWQHVLAAREMAIAEATAQISEPSEIKAFIAGFQDGAKDTAAHQRNILVNAKNTIAGGAPKNDIIVMAHEEFNGRLGVIPVVDDTGEVVGLDVRNNGEEFRGEQLKALYLTDFGWRVPKPNLSSTMGEDSVLRHYVYEHYTEALIDRLSLALIGPGKFIDTIVVETSDWGKDALFDLLGNAFPKCVGKEGAEQAFSTQGNRFSAATDPLTKHIWVRFNEADKISSGAIPVGQLNYMTEVDLAITIKHENKKSLRRVGTAYLVGGDFPAIGMAPGDPPQGLPERLGWVFWRGNDEDTMNRDDWMALRHDDVVAEFRNHLFQRAIDIWNTEGENYYTHRHDEGEECPECAASAKMFDAGVDELGDQFWAYFKEDAEGKVDNATLKQFVPLLASLGTKTFSATMRDKFGCTPYASNKARGWKGIALKDEYREDE